MWMACIIIVDVVRDALAEGFWTGVKHAYVRKSIAAASGVSSMLFSRVRRMILWVYVRRTIHQEAWPWPSEMV